MNWTCILYSKMQSWVSGAGTAPQYTSKVRPWLPFHCKWNEKENAAKYRRFAGKKWGRFYSPTWPDSLPQTEVSSRRTNFLHHLGQSSNMGKIWESDLGKMNFKHLIYLFLSEVEKWTASTKRDTPKQAKSRVNRNLCRKPHELVKNLYEMLKYMLTGYKYMLVLLSYLFRSQNQLLENWINNTGNHNISHHPCMKKSIQLMSIRYMGLSKVTCSDSQQKNLQKLYMFQKTVYKTG